MTATLQLPQHGSPSDADADAEYGEDVPEDVPEAIELESLGVSIPEGLDDDFQPGADVLEGIDLELPPHVLAEVEPQEAVEDVSSLDEEDSLPESFHVNSDDDIERPEISDDADNSSSEDLDEDNSEPTIELEDEGIDDLDFDPRDVSAQRSTFSFSNNPLIKTAGVAALGLAFAVLALGGWKMLTSSSKNSSQTQNIAVNNSDVLDDTAIDPASQSAQELAETKAMLAVSEQQEANAAFANRNAANEETDAADGEAFDGEDSADGEDRSSDTSPVTQTPSQTVVVPQPPPPSQQTVVRPAPVVAPPPVVAIAPPPAAYGSDLSPLEQWELVAKMGSFGNPSPVFQTTPMAMPVTPPQPTAPSLFNPSTYSSQTPAPVPSFSAPATVSGSQNISQLRNSSSVPGMRQTAMTSVLIGEFASGVLDTDIILSGDGTTNTNPNDPLAPKYLITLDDSILDVNGDVAIPAGAKIVSAVSNFSQGNGVVQLVAKSVLHDGVEYSLPEGAVLVQAEDGGFLTADSRRDGTSIGRALLPALLDGVAAVGDALNEDASSIVTNGSSSITTTSSESNIPAAAVGGFSSSLADSITRQAEQANQLASKRDDVWELTAGGRVKIVVNSTIQM